MTGCPTSCRWRTAGLGRTTCWVPTAGRRRSSPSTCRRILESWRCSTRRATPSRASTLLTRCYHARIVVRPAGAAWTGVASVPPDWWAPTVTCPSVPTTATHSWAMANVTPVPAAACVSADTPVATAASYDGAPPWCWPSWSFLRSWPTDWNIWGRCCRGWRTAWSSIIAARCGCSAVTRCRAGRWTTSASLRRRT